MPIIAWIGVVSFFLLSAASFALHLQVDRSAAASGRTGLRRR
jgi:hypothetical protein